MRTEDQHKILLVEDDLDIAEELVCTLESLGHECTHVETRDDAETAVEVDDYCLVLMDLQIKASADTLAPRIEAGRTLLERLRLVFSERLLNAAHRTPILVLSAHTKNREETMRLMQLGATDVLEKPMSNNEPGLDVRISRALAGAQRDRHGRCGGEAGLGEATPLPVLAIDVKRRQVRYRGIEVPTSTGAGRHLQKQSFGVLVAIARRPGERVTSSELNAFLFEHGLLDDNVGPNLSAIRSRIVGAIRDALPDDSDAADVQRLVSVSRGTICLRAPGPIFVTEENLEQQQGAP